MNIDVHEFTDNNHQHIVPVFMGYSSTNMHFISVVLFAVVCRSAKTEMSARDVYDILSGKIGSLSFDMELLRSDLRETKGRVTVIDKLLTDIATDKSDGTILDDEHTSLAVSNGDISKLPARDDSLIFFFFFFSISIFFR